jgi:hypothetical protein
MSRRVDTIVKIFLCEVHEISGLEPQRMQLFQVRQDLVGIADQIKTSMDQFHVERTGWLKTRSIVMEGCSEAVSGEYKWTPKVYNGQPIFKKDKKGKKDKTDYMMAMYKVRPHLDFSV